MIRRLLRFLLTRPLTWVAGRVSSAPDRGAVLKALTELYRTSSETPGSEGRRKLVMLDPQTRPVIIFSDQHRGTRNGSDDFGVCEPAYLAALDYYNQKEFHFINLGDCEELWENTIFGIARHNDAVYAREKAFLDRDAYSKVFGNHDLFWDNDPLAGAWLKKFYGQAIHIYAGVVMRAQVAGGPVDIFCTHGHQGDRQSDGNWFSKWFVSYVWGPLQSFLRINTNSPSTNDDLKTLHNLYMYDWSAAQQNVLLVTGHTHQPVFNSLTHLERLYLDLENARAAGDKEAEARIETEIPRRRREYDFVNHSFRAMKPTYFNTGCCCFEDGTITGLEFQDGFLRLVKWTNRSGEIKREVAEEATLENIAARIRVSAPASSAQPSVPPAHPTGTAPAPGTPV